MESDVEHGQAAVLRGTVATEQTSHGDSPRLQIQVSAVILVVTRNAQRDGRPAEYRWRPLFNAAKFG